MFKKSRSDVTFDDRPAFPLSIDLFSKPARAKMRGMICSTSACRTPVARAFEKISVDGQLLWH
jgi:hypothetical protein